MKVLLIKDVKGIGKAGELKEVKDGYGRNFLIGKGFALKATNEVMKKFESSQRKKAELEKEEIAKANEYKIMLDEIILVIEHKVGKKGVLIGSITKDEIATTLKEKHNIDINKKSINIDFKIRAVGSYKFDVKLGHGVHGIIRIDVVGVE